MIWLLLTAVVVLGVVVAVIRHRNYLAGLPPPEWAIYDLEHKVWPEATDEWYGHGKDCPWCQIRLRMRMPTSAELNAGHTHSLSDGGPDPQTGVWAAPDYTIADEWVQLERRRNEPIRWMPVSIEAAALGEAKPVYVPGGCEVVPETPSPQYERPNMYLGPPPGPRC
jgi:hypothetical protein